MYAKQTAPPPLSARRKGTLLGLASYKRLLYAATPCYAEATNLATFQAGFGNTDYASFYYLECPPRKK